MKLSFVLECLSKHNVKVVEDHTEADGTRTLHLAAALPIFPYAGRYQYSTLVLSPGQTEVDVEERDALKRRLGHMTTDVFGDDPDFAEIRAAGEDEDGESHLHSLVPKG